MGEGGGGRETRQQMERGVGGEGGERDTAVDGERGGWGRREWAEEEGRGTRL